MSNFEDVIQENTTIQQHHSRHFCHIFLKHVTPAAAGVLNSWASGPISFTHLLRISCHIGANGIVSVGVSAST